MLTGYQASMEDLVFSSNIFVSRLADQINFIVLRRTVPVIFVILDLEGRVGINATEEGINRRGQSLRLQALRWTLENKNVDFGVRQI